MLKVILTSEYYILDKDYPKKLVCLGEIRKFLSGRALIHDDAPLLRQASRARNLFWLFIYLLMFSSCSL